ncbi:MAG: sortase domain-bontaining protein [Gemmiger sp.]
MDKRPRFGHLKGDSAYYPYSARTRLRSRQRWAAGVLATLGLLVLAGAGALLVRQTVFRGGQPTPPPVAVSPTPQPSAAPTAPKPESARVTVRSATVDVLAATGQVDAAARAPAEPQPTPLPERTAEVLPRYRDVYEQNPDLVGWLTIEGAGIDLPVVQTPGDNEYYLRRGFDRLYALSGTLFADERCRLGEEYTANILIYGHNMADGSMFGQLDRYADEDFWKENPTFRFDTLYEEGTWLVAAVLRTTLGADALPYYTFFDAEGRADWQQKVDAIMELALFDTGVVPQYGDQLLTLSTCGSLNPSTDKRLAVLALRVE